MSAIKTELRRPPTNRIYSDFFRLQSTKPVNPSCNGFKPARKVLNEKRGRKSLEGLYETTQGGTSIVKTSNATVTIRVPGSASGRPFKIRDTRREE